MLNKLRMTNIEKYPSVIIDRMFWVFALVGYCKDRGSNASLDDADIGETSTNKRLQRNRLGISENKIVTQSHQLEN